MFVIVTSERLAAGAEAAAAWERALMGALLIRPRLIPAFARSHPPGWFSDDDALTIMRGIFCASTGRRMTIDDLIVSLELHDALDIAGGPDAIRALAAPRPALDGALRELDALLERLPPAEQEQVARDEDLDDLDELIELVQEPTTSAEPSGVGTLLQLELFAGGPPREEDDHA